MSDQDEIERSGAELDRPEIERFRKLELVRKLIKLRRDPRVGVHLVKLLTDEQDTEVVKTVLLGLGMMKDKKYTRVLLKFVEHPSMRVTAAAIKSLCKLDPNMEVQTLHPLLASRDAKARLAAVLALMSHNERLGNEMLDQLAISDNPELRLTAVKCLETIPEDHAQELVVRMFVPESKLSVLKEISRTIKKRGVSREGLERLNAYRAELKASHPASDEGRELRDTKLAILERLQRRSYEKMDLSAGTIGTLEGQVEKQASAIETKLVEEEKKKEEARRTGQQRKLTQKAEALKRGPPWMKVIGGFALIIAAGAGLHFASRSEERPPPQKLAVAKVEIPSVIGKAGEHVTITAEVLHVYKKQRSVALKAQKSGAVMICAVFEKLPDAARTGAKVRLEGVIQNVEGTTSLTVVGERLDPAT